MKYDVFMFTGVLVFTRFSVKPSLFLYPHLHLYSFIDYSRVVTLGSYKPSALWVHESREEPYVPVYTCGLTAFEGNRKLSSNQRSSVIHQKRGLEVGVTEVVLGRVT